MNLVKKNLKYLFLIIIVVLFAYTIIFKGNFSIILESMKEANFKYTVICGILAVLYYFLDAINLTMYARIFNKGYKFIQGLVIAFISPFFNGITPFASGGQVAQVYVFNKQGVETRTAIGIMLMHFILYQFVLVAFSATILILQFNYFQTHFTSLFILGLFGFLINSTVITALVLGSISKTFQEFVIKVLFKIGYKCHLIKDYQKSVNKYYNQLDEFRSELKLLFQHQFVMIFSLMLNVIRLAFVYSIPYFAFKALNIDTSVAKFYIYIGITSFISLVTAFIPIPGASGGSEGAFTLMFGCLLGTDQSRLGMLIWRFVTYYLMMFLGFAVFMINEKLTEGKDA